MIIITIKTQNYLHMYVNLPGAPLQNCLDLYDNVTSTTPGMCLGGTCTLIAWDVINCKQRDGEKTIS